jgi:site-specific recombinase XerC
MTYLPKQRLESPKTQRNYKLSIKLFLDYLESKGIANLTIACLKADMINGWIQWMLEKRGNCAQTCNTRLAALKSFIKYIGVRDTTMKSLYYDTSEYVENLKAPKRKIHGFSRAAITALFAIPDKSKKGIRDLAFMVLLYGAALRLDEILSIQIKHLHLDIENPFVNIIGKRHILRSPFLLSGIVKHINRYISVYHDDIPDPEDFLFYSPCGNLRGKLSQESMRKRVKQIASKAHEICSEVPLSLHPHQFRQYVEYHNMGSEW